VILAFNLLTRGAPGRIGRALRRRVFGRALTQRVAERIRVAHETVLIVRKGKVVYEARVSDITSHGFMVRADADIRKRDLIEIRLPVAGWIPAQVRWTGAQDGQLGCKFLKPMAPEDFEACLAVIIP